MFASTALPYAKDMTVDDAAGCCSRRTRFHSAQRDAAARVLDVMHVDDLLHLLLGTVRILCSLLLASI